MLEFGTDLSITYVMGGLCARGWAPKRAIRETFKGPPQATLDPLPTR